jgi:hypothetical protein
MVGRMGQSKQSISIDGFISTTMIAFSLRCLFTWMRVSISQLLSAIPLIEL